MTDRSVVVAGGGPTGMILAAELTLAGADVVVVERRRTVEIEGSRAGGLHTRTIEVLDQRGVAERFLAEGEPMPSVFYAGAMVDISVLPARRPQGLALWQSHFERILGGWTDELGVEVLRGTEVAGFAQDDDGVDVTLADGSSIRARYLVGCDGGRSLVRKTAGIGFPGLDPTLSYLLAEVDTTETPELGVRREGGGIGPVNPKDGGSGPYRMVLRELEVEHDRNPTFEDLRSLLVAKFGTDWGVHSPTWITRFTDATRQAETYRRGRVLLAGDAAHVHPPYGGQGLNVGVQDAVNLGWKLARVLDGSAPDSLLDSYHDERHAVGARVLQAVMAMTTLVQPDERHDALRAQVAELLTMDGPRRRIGAMIAGLDIRYGDGDDAHPLVGRRVPDLDLVTDAGPTRVFALLHAARPVLLVLDGAPGPDVAPWRDRVDVVTATSDGPWELPLVGEVAAPAAVLVRPDGHVAWAGDLGDPTLPVALERWFGPATRS